MTMAHKKLKYSKDLLRLDNIDEADKYPNLHLKNKNGKIEKKIFQLPVSSVLDRVKEFLPQMKVADEELKHLQETSQIDNLNIENIDESDGPVIEMNLALVERESSDDSDVDSSVNDDETEDDSDRSSVNFDEITEKNLKLPSHKHKCKNLIEEIEVTKNSDKA